jgi:L-threonylcarbamoyladenylate synthase
MKSSASVTRIYRGTDRNLALLARHLRQGGLVGVPTETVYGLAANALDADACAKIFAAKGRPANDPLIVHIVEPSQLAVIARPNAVAEKLAQAFWPGPLTLVLPKQAVVPDIVTAGLDSVAVRMPAHALFRRLLRRCGVPLAAPSANPFGYISPTTAEHVRIGLHHRIRCILDGGPARIGLESTIVDVRDPGAVRLLRPGAITAAQIEKILRRKIRGAPGRAGKADAAQIAPGQLSRHYSPRTKLVLHRRLSDRAAPLPEDGIAWLHFKKPVRPFGDHCYWLDAGGDQIKAARNLFSRLRMLDGRGYRCIHAELAPAGPRAEAINDRLRRAAAV